VPAVPATGSTSTARAAITSSLPACAGRERIDITQRPGGLAIGLAPMLRRAWLTALPLVLSACFMARTDARVRPGFHVGVAAAEAWTPSARSHLDEEFPDESMPYERDAANLRTFGELRLAYGFDRHTELSWRAGMIAPTPADPYQYDHYDAYPGALELFVGVLDRGPWHVGLGLETIGAELVVTHELSPASALTLSLHTTTYEANAQAAFVRTYADFDLAAFAGVVTPAWGEDRLHVREDFCWEGCNQTTAGAFALFGLSLTSH
jgi:hypothetical protein